MFGVNEQGQDTLSGQFNRGGKRGGSRGLAQEQAIALDCEKRRLRMARNRAVIQKQVEDEFRAAGREVSAETIEKAVERRIEQIAEERIERDLETLGNAASRAAILSLLHF